VKIRQAYGGSGSGGRGSGGRGSGLLLLGGRLGMSRRCHACLGCV
jgi:hypothetical protein